MAEQGSPFRKKYLGEVLVEKGLVSKEDIDQALRVQVGGNRRLGYILIKMGLLSDDNLMTALSDQLDVPIVQVDKEFRQEVKG